MITLGVSPPGKYIFLDVDTPILKTDLIRHTVYTEGFGDNIDHAAVELMNWSLASDFFPKWIGGTLREYYKFNVYLGEPDVYTDAEIDAGDATCFEMIRRVE